MKKKLISLLLAVAMLTSAIPLSAITVIAESGEENSKTLQSSTEGQTIGEVDTVSYYRVDSDTSCTAAEPKVSGLSILDYAEVHIIVEKGVTLTCKGGDASGFMGGGAGIEVPEHATLYLEGEGTVIATGGNAANGTAGMKGERGSIERETAYLIFDDFKCYGGAGGQGGGGGSGAGAGIGTIGGAGGRGGYGGAGDGGDADEDHTNVAAGEKGVDGKMANPAGTVFTSRTVKLSAAGGAAGQPGTSPAPHGVSCIKVDYYNTAVCGCPGGGGQGGGAGASVGNGGQGGGGGAGGNGGPAFFGYESGFYGAKLYSGYGGGNTDGNYIEGSNMGEGGTEYNCHDVTSSLKLWGNYPYRERAFGGAGGTDSVHVHTFDEDGWCTGCAKSVFLIEDGVLLEYNGFGGTVVIPDGVTRIANNVFVGNQSVTGVVFPSTLEEIGSSAFNHSGLAGVTFPSSVKTIGHNAFQDCASLTSVTFPEEGEITILNSTFQGTPLTVLDLPASVKAIGYNAFRGCAGLKNITVHWSTAGEIVTPLGDAFTGIASDCALSVPPDTAQLYKDHTVWGRFLLISDTTLYMAYDPVSGTFVQNASLLAPTPLTSSDGPVSLPGGWYTAGTVTVNGSLTFEGDAYVILENGASLTVNGGIVVGSSLTFYAQTTDPDEMGRVYVPAPSEDGKAGIRCTTGQSLQIHGGNFEVYGSRYAAGIGGNDNEPGGDVTVCGGCVTAHSKADGAGIGGGRSSAGGTFTVYGGKVDAYGSYSAGIGGGRGGAGGTITINGGEISSNSNLGVGYEYGGISGTTVVTVNGGKVTVSGDNSIVGGSNSTTLINGGEVKVQYGTVGAGNGGKNAMVRITGGSVDVCGYYSPAIGGSTDNVTVDVCGGSIRAKANSTDAVVASEFNLCPDAAKCEIFTVKDLSGSELSCSPVREETELSSALAGEKQIQIDPGFIHTFDGAYVNNDDGTHSRTCSVCGVLNAAASHTFVNHTCICGETNGHDYTGAYTDNGNGTHSRYCTECDAKGATEDHVFAQFVCVCGAVDLDGAKLKAEAVIAEAVKDAAAAASSAAADKALNEIEKAGTLAEINQIVEDAIAEIETAEAALLDAKTAALEALGADGLMNDDNETVVKGAILAISNAAAPESVTAIYDLAMVKIGAIDDLVKARGENSQTVVGDAITDVAGAADADGVAAITALALVKIEAIDTIAAAITPQNETLAGEGIAAVTKAADADEVAAAKEAALAKMQAADAALAAAKAAAIAKINGKKTAANAVFADKALVDIEAAALSADVACILETALADMKAADEALEAAKAAAEAEIESKKTAQNAAIAALAQEKIGEAETEDAVTDLLNKALAAMEAADNVLKQDKATAKATISKKKTAANREIAEKALLDIEAATMSAAVANILETALADMQAADLALEEAKAAAEAEIESKKTEQNAAIAAAALHDIDAAETEDAVTDLLNAALADMKAADEALTAAKAAAIEAVNEKKTAANKAIADKALTDIEEAKTSAEVASVLAVALADMKAVDDTLAAAKDAAGAAINDAGSEANAEIAKKALADIDEAITVEAVESIKAAALEAMRCADLLAEAEALLEDAVCDEAKAILTQAITEMNAAETADAMAAILETAKTESKKEDTDYADYLEYYLNDPNKYIQDFCSEETLAAIENVKAQLQACKSIAGLREIHDANEDALAFLYFRDDSANTLRNFAKDPNLPEAIRLLAAEALPKVLAAETAEEMDAICTECFGKMEFEWAKWEVVEQYRANTEDDTDFFSDEMKAIYRDLMEKVIAAEDWDELTCIGNEDEIRTDAQGVRDELFRMIAMTEEEEGFEFVYYYVEAYTTEEYRAFAAATLEQLQKEEEASLAVIDKVRAGEEDIDCLDDLTNDFYAFKNFLGDKLDYAAQNSYYLLDSYGYPDLYKVLTRDFLEEYVSALTEEQETAVRNAYEDALDLIEYKESRIEYLTDWLPDDEELSETLCAVLEVYTARIMAAADMQEADDIYEQGDDAIYIVYMKEHLTQTANGVLADGIATEAEKAFAEELLEELSGIPTAPHLELTAEQLAAAEAQMQLTDIKYDMLEERQDIIRGVNYWINHESATEGEKSEEFRMAFENILATLDAAIDGLIPAVKAAEADGFSAIVDAMDPFWETREFLTDAVLSDCADSCTYLYEYAKENRTEAYWELACAYLDEYSKGTSYDELDAIEERYAPLFALMTVKENYVKQLRQDVVDFVGTEVFVSENVQIALKEAEAYILAAESEEEAYRRYEEVNASLYPTVSREYMIAMANSALDDETAPAALKELARALLADLENVKTADEIEALLNNPQYLLLDIRYYFLIKLDVGMDAENAPEVIKTPEFLAVYQNMRANYNAFITDLIPVFLEAETEDEIYAALDTYDEGEKFFMDMLDTVGSIIEELLKEETGDLAKKLLRLYIDDLGKTATQAEFDEVAAVYEKRGKLLPLKEEICEDLQQGIIDDGGTDELWAIYEEQEMKILLAEDEDTVQDLYQQTRDLLVFPAIRAYLLDIANEILHDETASGIQKEFANEMLAAVEAAKTLNELFAVLDRYTMLESKVNWRRSLEEDTEETPDFYKTDEFRAAVENVMATLDGAIDQMIPDFRAATDESVGDVGAEYHDYVEAFSAMQLNRICDAFEKMAKAPCSAAMQALYLEYIDGISKAATPDEVAEIYEAFKAKRELLTLKETYVNLLNTALSKLESPSEAIKNIIGAATEAIMKAETAEDVEKAMEEYGAELEIQYLSEHILYAGVSLTLAGSISMNFYMDMDIDGPSDLWDLGEMTFTIGEGKNARTVTGVKSQLNDNGRYFSCPLNVLEMAETVTATFSYYGHDYVETFSIPEYLEIILEGEDAAGNPYSDEAKELARKISDYGYYVQAYLESIHENVTVDRTGTGIGYTPMEPLSKITIDPADGEDLFEAPAATENFAFYGRTVYFDSATALNFYVRVKQGTIESAFCESKNVEVKKYSGDIWQVSIKDIEATELGSVFTVSLNGGEFKITGTVLDYCAAVVKLHTEVEEQTPEDVLAVNAMLAFVEYGIAACDYAYTLIAGCS